MASSASSSCWSESASPGSSPPPGRSIYRGPLPTPPRQRLSKNQSSENRMASAAPAPAQECPACGAALTPGALACGQCHALVHAERLEQLAAAARRYEERG